MIDPCLERLAAQLDPSEAALWLAAEGSLGVLHNLVRAADLHVLTNRFDIYRTAQTLGLHATFNDWLTPTRTYQSVFLRLCKEKSINQHLAKLAWHSLATGGRLVVSGQKDEGIKTYASALKRLFVEEFALRKDGNTYLTTLRKTAAPNAAPEQDDYAQFALIGQLHGKPVYSKPGQFGWQKIDQGSAFLINTLEQHKVSFVGQQVLDLGCGYGYLTLATQHLGARSYTVTDNNAAALLSVQRNIGCHALPALVVAADCADTITEQFTTVLCNPPFHAAFAIDNHLTDAFVHAAHQRLTAKGHAFFVTNSFIPLEKKARPLFKQVELLANNKQFKVTRLAK